LTVDSWGKLFEFHVIARSVATKQSSETNNKLRRPGLLRRYAPRNDGYGKYYTIAIG